MLELIDSYELAEIPFLAKKSFEMTSECSRKGFHLALSLVECPFFYRTVYASLRDAGVISAVWNEIYDEVILPKGQCTIQSLMRRWMVWYLIEKEARWYKETKIQLPCRVHAVINIEEQWSRDVGERRSEHLQKLVKISQGKRRGIYIEREREREERGIKDDLIRWE